jgi:hypothetical protein
MVLSDEISKFEIEALESNAVGSGIEVFRQNGVGIVIRDGKVIGSLSLMALNLDLTDVTTRRELFFKAREFYPKVASIAG